MPQRTSRPGPPSFYFGVWGAGETSGENITGLLTDYIDGLGNVTPKFVIPLVKDYANESVQAVAQYALDNEYEVHVVYEKKPQTKGLKDILALATKETVAEAADADAVPFEPTEIAVADTLLNLIRVKPDNAKLLFLWPGDEGAEDQIIEENERVLYASVDSGVEVLDLTAGLEIMGTEEGDAPTPEPEETPKKTAAKKTAAKPDPEPEPEAEPEGIEPREVVEAWPIRRIRTYVREVANAEREENPDTTPTDEDLADSDAWKKEDLLTWLYSGEVPAEAETAEDPGEITPARARKMREDAEANGTDSTTKNKRAAAKKTAAAEPEEVAETPEEPAEGEETGEDGVDDGEGHLQALTESMWDLIEAWSGDDGDAVNSAIINAADCFADHIIYRIAQRVEVEPETSPVRKTVAPPRPPGAPRGDGAAPTRRRTAK